MSQAFSIKDRDTYIDIEEDSATGHVVITFETVGQTHTIMLEAEDLARALLTASPTFNRRVAETVHRALVNSLTQ